MTRRHVRRRYRRNPADGSSTRRTTRRPEPACAELDVECFEALVQARVKHLFGDSLAVVAPDPELREAVHDAVAKGLRGPKRLIPPDSLEFAARIERDGVARHAWHERPPRSP